MTIMSSHAQCTDEETEAQKAWKGQIICPMVTTHIYRYLCGRASSGGRQVNTTHSLSSHGLHILVEGVRGRTVKNT